MRTLISLIVFLFVAVSFIHAKKERVGCNKACMAEALAGKVSKSELRSCITGCLASKGTKDDTVKTIKTLESYIKQLKKGVQTQEARLGAAYAQAINETRAQAKAFSDNAETLADLAKGSTLEVTASALNVRSGPCTDKSVMTSLSGGARVQYTGSATAACGYTWYQVTGSFGTGFVASNFVREVSGGSKPSGSACSTRNYPLFKQCDGKWGNNRLGSDSTICKVGCLMSSVSMALNGLGKQINGQASNPGVLNSYLLSHHGYMGNLFVWGAVSNFGLHYVGQPTSASEIKNYICQNQVVILNVNHGGHWVLATGVNADGSYSVHDPGFSRSSYAASEVVRAGVYKL